MLALSPVCSVYPSGAALAATSVPVSEPAPGKFWTTKGWPSCLDSCSPTIRETMSVPPPGVEATIMVTGRAGYSAARSGADAMTPAATAIAAIAMQRRLDKFHPPIDLADTAALCVAQTLRPALRRVYQKEGRALLSDSRVKQLRGDVVAELRIQRERKDTTRGCSMSGRNAVSTPISGRNEQTR